MKMILSFRIFSFTYITVFYLINTLAQQLQHSEESLSQRDYSYYNLEPSDTSREYIEDSAALRVFRTYGHGKAQITRQGQTVIVPNEQGRKVRYRGLGHKENENETKRHKGCRDCPNDQTVYASNGNTFVILPEPCSNNPKMWNHYTGPRPGSKVSEGVHTIQGYIGQKRKFCQYNYEVLVRRCESLEAKSDLIIKCSAENAWGSNCTVSCLHDKEPLGTTDLECREDLTWSNSLPLCKSKNDCSAPKIKKISCQTTEMTQIEGEIIPNGSTCKFQQNGKDMSLNCKDGKWRILRKSKKILPKKNKKPSKQEKKDVCNPNPCENGGTCLRTESSNSPPVCKCRPQTRGLHCEMRECYYNICENDGLCFYQNEERVCYCTSDYSGNICQHYTPK